MWWKQNKTLQGLKLADYFWKLDAILKPVCPFPFKVINNNFLSVSPPLPHEFHGGPRTSDVSFIRSEERRVGKECRSRGSP